MGTISAPRASRMNRRAILSALALVSASALAVRGVSAQSTKPNAPRPAASAAPARDGDRARVERGDYLTHHVAMCVECHSPRDRSGTIIRAEEFRGAPNPFPAPFPGVPWAIRSVNIRGLGGLPAEAVVRLLTSGIGRNGAPPDPPMPRFRMSAEDAEAIVAYLRSLD